MIKWATDMAVKKKGKGKEESEIKDKFWLTAKLNREGLIQVTNLFEIGHIRCKIFKFTILSMKQVCKLEKKNQFFMFTLNSPMESPLVF